LEVFALVGHEVLGPEPPHQLDGFSQAAETLFEAGPLDSQDRNLVHRLAGPHAEKYPSWGELIERRHCLRHDGRVIAKGRRDDAGAKAYPARPLSQRRQPGKGERRVAIGVSPGLKVVAYDHAVESALLGMDRKVEQFARWELLSGRLVAQSQPGHLSTPPGG